MAGSGTLLTSTVDQTAHNDATTLKSNALPREEIATTKSVPYGAQRLCKNLPDRKQTDAAAQIDRPVDLLYGSADVQIGPEPSHPLSPANPSRDFQR